MHHKHEWVWQHNWISTSWLIRGYIDLYLIIVHDPPHLLSHAWLLDIGHQIKKTDSLLLLHAVVFSNIETNKLRMLKKKKKSYIKISEWFTVNSVEKFWNRTISNVIKWRNINTFNHGDFVVLHNTTTVNTSF